VTGLDEFVVVGSQAILGSLEQPPESMLQSLEVDIYPLRDPRAADLIDGALGDGSQFEARRALSTGFGGDDRRLHKIDRTRAHHRARRLRRLAITPQERCRPSGELETSGGQEQPAATSGQSS
jgi:hypothetical protein